MRVLANRVYLVDGGFLHVRSLKLRKYPTLDRDRERLPRYWAVWGTSVTSLLFYDEATYSAVTVRIVPAPTPARPGLEAGEGAGGRR